jgi:aminobenzoyl-glutamate utilization protein B
MLGGKVLAATAIRLFSDRPLLTASQQELAQVLAERPYRCPIPQEVKPSILNNKARDEENGTGIAKNNG